MSPRAKSATAVANDNKIRDAAIEIADRIGLQHLRFGHIVEHTQLTTGALYSRFSDHNDLLASLWVERLSQPTHELITDAINAFESDDKTNVEKLAARLHKLTKTEWAGLEALVIARRIPELDEVVSEDVTEWFTSFGLSPQFAGSDIAGIRVITILSLTIACAFNSFIDKGVDEWQRIFALHRSVLADLQPVEDTVSANEISIPVVANTGEQLRDTLINATADVIARSGLDGATLARIARRARMTSGAVYTLYSTKDELIEDALRVLISSAGSDTASLVHTSQGTQDTFTAAMQVYSLAFDPARKNFRRLRLETLLSARTDSNIRSLVRSVYRQRIKEYEELFGTDTHVPSQFVRNVARVGQFQPLGFAFLEHYINGAERINLLPLSRSISRNVYQGVVNAN
jgi:AcrR family transcriptional regulator